MILQNVFPSLFEIFISVRFHQILYHRQYIDWIFSSVRLMMEMNQPFYFQSRLAKPQDGSHRGARL